MEFMRFKFFLLVILPVLTLGIRCRVCHICEREPAEIKTCATGQQCSISLTSGYTEKTCQKTVPILGEMYCTFSTIGRPTCYCDTDLCNENLEKGKLPVDKKGLYVIFLKFDIKSVNVL